MRPKDKLFHYHSIVSHSSVYQSYNWLLANAISNDLFFHCMHQDLVLFAVFATSILLSFQSLCRPRILLKVWSPKLLNISISAWARTADTRALTGHGYPSSSESIRCCRSHISVYLGSNACIISSVMTRPENTYLFSKSKDFSRPCSRAKTIWGQSASWLKTCWPIPPSVYTPLTSTSTNSPSSRGSRRVILWRQNFNGEPAFFAAVPKLNRNARSCR